MLDYLHTGLLNFESHDILELLELCQEYLLPDMKQLIEQIMVRNIDFDNFGESMQISRSFDCKILKDNLFLFG